MLPLFLPGGIVAGSIAIAGRIMALASVSPEIHHVRSQ